MYTRSRLLSLVLTLFVATLSAPTAAQAFALKTMATGVDRAVRVVPSAAGGVWVLQAQATSTSGSTLARVDAAGRVTRVTGIPPTSELSGLAAAADGGFWTYDGSRQTLDHVGPGGSLTNSTPLAADAGSFAGLALGPDGRPWMLVDRYVSGGIQTRWLLRLAADGSIVRVAGQPVVPAADDLVLGSDGRMWMPALDGVTAISGSGAATTYRYAGSGGPTAIAPGRDGRLVIATADSRVLSMTTAGKTTRLARFAAAGAAPTDAGRYAFTLTYARSGRLWLVAEPDDVVDVSPSGRVTHHGPGKPADLNQTELQPEDLATDRDGRVWIATYSGRIVRVVSGPACQVPHLLDRTRKAATQLLAKAGCRARIRRGHDRGAGPVRVVAQSVEADRVLHARVRVRVTLARIDETCAYDPTRWRTVASDREDVLTLRQTPSRDPESDLQHGYVSGCVHAAGRRWTIDRWATDGVYGDERASAFTMAGHWAAFLRVSSMKEASTSRAVIADLRSRRARTVTIGSGDGWSPQPVPTSLALGSAGQAAWTTTAADPSGGPPLDPCDTVHIQTATGPDRTIATSSTCGVLTDVSIDATTVRWKDSGVARSAPIG